MRVLQVPISHVREPARRAAAPLDRVAVAAAGGRRAEQTLPAAARLAREGPPPDLHLEVLQVSRAIVYSRSSLPDGLCGYAG